MKPYIVQEVHKLSEAIVETELHSFIVCGAFDRIERGEVTVVEATELPDRCVSRVVSGGLGLTLPLVLANVAFGLQSGQWGDIFSAAVERRLLAESRRRSTVNLHADA